MSKEQLDFGGFSLKDILMWKKQAGGVNQIKLRGHNIPVQYTGTVLVADGIMCDSYSTPGSQVDLAIVTVLPGFNTPLQRVLNGKTTIEQHQSGNGALMVIRSDDTKRTLIVGPSLSKAMEVKVGELMQWTAIGYLKFVEFCDPPYEEGRFENIKQ